MAADQVQEKPKEADAKASDAAAGKPAEAPKNEVKEAEQGANDKMQQEVSGTAAQNKSDAGSQDVAETNKVNDGAEATAETSQSTREKLSVEANLTSPEANKAAAETQIKFDPNKTILSTVDLQSFSNLASSETKTEPTEKVIDGVKAFELTGKSRLAEGETKKYDDLKIMHDGKVLLDFDDADIVEAQFSAKIGLNLPDSAKSETIDGAGTRSLIQDKDGGTTEVIKAEDGTVYIRQGEQYYMAKTGFYGQVIEGKEAKEAFETKSEEFGAGAKVINHSAVSATNAISIQQKDGTELVSVDKDGKVDTKIPGDAFIIGGTDGQRAILTDGTQMVKSDKGTTILNSDGRVIQVGVDGAVKEYARGDADGQAAWKAEASRFETNVKPTGTDGAFSFSDSFNISDWLYSGSDTSFSFSDFSFDNFDWGDTALLFDDPLLGDDFKTYAAKDLTCKVDPNFDLANFDFKDFYIDKGIEYTDKQATSLENAALESGKSLTREEALGELGGSISKITLADGTQASFDMMKTLSKGLQGENVEQSQKGDEIAQIDTKTGVTRIYNTQTKEVTLSYTDNGNPGNSFYMEAVLNDDGSVSKAKSVFSDKIITKDGDTYKKGEFGAASSSESLELRVKGDNLKNATTISSGDAGELVRTRMGDITLKDGNKAVFDSNDLILNGLKGDGIETSRRGENEIAQFDPKTGITRIENKATGEVTLSYMDADNPENSFYMEAHKGPDGKIERSKTAFHDGVITREGDNFTHAEFADRSEVISGNAISIRLKNQNLTSASIFSGSNPHAAVSADNGAALRNQRLAIAMVTDPEAREGANPGDQAPVEIFTQDDKGVQNPDLPNLERMFYDPRSNTFFKRCGGERQAVTAAELAEKGIRIEDRDGHKYLIDTRTGNAAFRLEPGKRGGFRVVSIDEAGRERGTLGEREPGVIETTVRDTRPKSADDPTAGSTITDVTDTNNQTAAQTIRNGDGTVKINADIDLKTDTRIDRNAEGEVVAKYEFKDGAVQYESPDFRKTFDFTVTNDNGYVYANNGNIFDSDGDYIFDSSTGSFNASDGWSASGYSPYGYSSPEQMALEARAESEAQTASGLAAAVASKVAAAVATGNVSVVMSSLGEIAGAYAAISAAQGIAIQAGDTALAGMLSLQTSQVNAAAGQVVATIVNVQENNRVGGPMEGDSALAKGLTSLTYSISNPLMKRAQILHGMGRDDDPIVKQILGKDTENA